MTFCSTKQLCILSGFLFGLIFIEQRILEVNFTRIRRVVRANASLEGNDGNNSTVFRVDNTTRSNETAFAPRPFEEIRLLCWIMTSPTNVKKKAIHVRDTWAKRCDITLFMSSEEDKDLPAVGLPVEEGRQNLYNKTKAAFEYVWKKYKDEADWFMKADDDTYVIVENLKFLLKDYDPSKPYYFGRRFKHFLKQGYMSGGAGYVLSRESVKRYVDGIISGKCEKKGDSEDVEIGRCLEIVGVEAMDSRDSVGKEAFFPLNLNSRSMKNATNPSFWLRGYSFYTFCDEGKDCFSRYPISIHYVTPQYMYVYEYIFYDAKVHNKFTVR